MGKLFSPPSRGRSREKPIFMRFSRKYLIFGSDSEPFSRLSGSWLRNGAIFRLWHQNWCRFLDWNFCVGIKIDAILITSSLIPSKSSHLARVIFKNLSPLLIPSGKGRFLSGFQKISAHFNPYLRVALLTYPARISPTIHYSNFWTRKTTHFPKLFQKGFLLLYRKFFRSNLNPYFKNFFSTTVTGTFAVLSGTQIAKKAEKSACLVFRSRRYIFSGIQL